MNDGAATRGGARRADAVLGRVIAGKFRIESYVGGGAMGAVYRARQMALDKDVAVKLLHGEHAGDATFAARFQREARAASKLDHPNSMRVIDFGQEPDGLLYIAMEFLDGRDLFHVIREDWPLPAARVADLLSQALAALAVAHDMGIVHRDLKPENIMVLSGTDDEGRPHDIVKVCDFGIAKFTDPREAREPGSQKLTTQGIVVGTPEYMSPEQGKGEALDARSDLYSMGVILYQMLTGRVPFDAESALGVVLKHVTEDPVPPRESNPGAHPRLEAICLKAMRKKREERYQNAREMRHELRAVVASSDPAAHAATVELPVAVSGSATTALALDSSKIAAAVVTASKMTPPGTATDAVPVAGSGRRAAVVAVALVAVLAGAAGTWALRGRLLRHAPAIAAAEVAPTATPSPSTAIEPLHPSSVDAPPLQLTAHSTTKTSAPTPAAPIAKTAGARLAAAPASPPSPAPIAATTAATAAPAPTVSASPPAPEPPAPAAAPAPAASNTPPPAAAAPPFDPLRGRVDWSVAGAGGGATPGAVQRALSRRSAAWNDCYRAGLAHRAEKLEGSAVMHLTTDESGGVVGVTVRGFDAMPGVKSCIAGLARVRIDGVDTGDAWADVQLSFRAE